jgi:hypothetical protein
MPALLAGCAGDGGAGGVSGYQPALRFDREHVILRIRPGAVEVEGAYEFLCAAGGPDSVLVFYPYPRDSLLGSCETLVVDGRCGDEPGRPVTFHEHPPAGVQWWVPLSRCRRLTVHTIYRQVLRADYARYIVTTTSAWKRPLRRASFEIHLPSGAVPEEFSFPFKRESRLGPGVWTYETRDFMPDRDVTVRWRWEEGGDGSGR